VILEKVKQIRDKIEATENYKQNLKPDETQSVSLEIKDVDFEIDNLKIEKVKDEKRDEKLKISQEELINMLKQELAKFNVEVV